MQPKAFEIEIVRVRPQLYREAERLLRNGDEAEDIVQDTILKLWAMRDRLDEYRSMDGLAVIVARRLAPNRIRAMRVHETWRGDGSNEGEMLLNDTELSPEEQLVWQERQSQLYALIASLPDKQQAILRMKHLDGMETGQIAQLVGCTEQAVRQSLSRARRRIWESFRR